jgi:hypothetical protein
MRTRSTAAVVVASLVTVAEGARAGPPQQPEPAQPQARPQSQVTSAESQFRAIGVSLDRIRRELREQPPIKMESVARLRYHIEVVGRMPRIDILKGFNIDKASAVPYGGMTHSEFLRITAPPWRKW